MLGVFITDRVQKIETENNAVRVKGKKVGFRKCSNRGRSEDDDSVT